MGHPPYPPPPAASVTRPGTVLAAVVMAYVGSAVTVLGGLMLAIGARNGEFLGRRTADVQVAGSTIPIERAGAVGIGLAVLGVAVVVLAVLTQRGRGGARVGLTVLGVGVVGVLGFSALTGDPGSPLVPLVWIAVAVVLLWVGGNGWFRRVRV